MNTYKISIDGNVVELTRTELIKRMNEQADQLASMFNEIERLMGFKEAERWANQQMK